MVNKQITITTLRVAQLLTIAVLLSGCELSNKWLQGRDTAAEQSLTVPASTDADHYLQELLTVADGDPASQAEAYADAASAAKLAPSPLTELRLALVLATPGHAEADPEKAQSLLREVLTQTELLTPAEIALATINLKVVEQLIVLNSEARSLRAASSRQARTEERAVSQRLSSIESENRRLRRELEDAKNKLDAITSIERSIREQ